MNANQIKNFGVAFHKAVLEDGLELDKAYEYCRLDVEACERFHGDWKKIEERRRLQTLAQQQFEILNQLKLQRHERQN